MKRKARHRVLIVDRSEAFRDLVAEMVADTGLLPVLAKDTREGLAHVRQGVGLVVCEVRTGELDGSRFLWRIRAIDWAPPILLIPDEPLAIDILEAEALGVAGCLLRPFTHFEFREALDAALYDGRRTLSVFPGAEVWPAETLAS